MYSLSQMNKILFRHTQKTINNIYGYSPCKHTIILKNVITPSVPKTIWFNIVHSIYNCDI